MFIKYYSRHETVGNDNFNQDYSYIIYFLVCNYFCFVFYNFISARTLINTLLLTHSRTKPAVPWLHTVGSTTNNRGNLFLKVHSVQKRRGCVLAQVSLIFLVRPSSHSSIAHFFKSQNALYLSHSSTAHLEQQVRGFGAKPLLGSVNTVQCQGQVA